MGSLHQRKDAVGFRGKIFPDGDVKVLISKTNKGPGFMEVYGSRCSGRLSEGL